MSVRHREWWPRSGQRDGLLGTLRTHRRQQIKEWLIYGQYGWSLEDGVWADRVYELQERLIERPGRWLTCLFWGHCPIPAGNPSPACDHCVWCGQHMPGQA